jgi:hypothetical protein
VILRSRWLAILAVALIFWGVGAVLTGDPWGLPAALVASGYLWWRIRRYGWRI